MTGSLVHLLPVAVCSFAALFLSDMLRVSPVYEALLERIMHGTGGRRKEHKAGSLIEIPVELGSAAAGKRISEIEWPAGVLVAEIRRGEHIIIPQGETVVLPGDYLLMLSSKASYQDASIAARQLCHPNQEERR
jgi:NhaP-type Na+/H+ and K+/H+ antiporter